MDLNAEYSTQLSLINVLLSDIDRTIKPSAGEKNEKKEKETQNAMPDSTTFIDKSNKNAFRCGDDVFVPNKDGKYYLGTIVEFVKEHLADSGEHSPRSAQCLVKFGDGTHKWTSVSALQPLSAPPAEDGSVMCVVCKRRESSAEAGTPGGVTPCDMCGRGYHVHCHPPPYERNKDASWLCKRCVEQRFRVAAAENKASRRADSLRCRTHDSVPLFDNGSTTSPTNSEMGDSCCYCNNKEDIFSMMLTCCRCSRSFHQRCVDVLQYPLYSGDKWYIFSCAHCNGGAEYLRRLEVGWVELAHLALYNLTAFNAPNYFDLDAVILPYIMDNWHALQLPEKMSRTPVGLRRERLLTALTSSRKRFKSGREMKKRATIWGLRVRRPAHPPAHLAHLQQIKKGVPLTDELVRSVAPRLRFLPRAAASPSHSTRSSCSERCTYENSNQQWIVPIDGEWLNIMTGKRFHESLSFFSENDSTSSCESVRPMEPDDQLSCNEQEDCNTAFTQSEAKDSLDSNTNSEDSASVRSETDKTDEPHSKALEMPLVPCSVKLDKIPTEDMDVGKSNKFNSTYSTRIETMNLELSKSYTKSTIEHSKILSLQQVSAGPYLAFNQEMESSSDETSSRGTLDAIIPPLKDFQGKNNPFLMQNISKASLAKQAHKQNGRKNGNIRHSLPMQLNPAGVGRPMKRKLSEKDIIIGPKGEVKRRKYRRPRKYMQQNKSLAADGREDSSAFGGRQLRQRPRRASDGGSLPAHPARTLHITAGAEAAAASGEEASALKSRVQSYYRAGQPFRVLARRMQGARPPAYLIQWDSPA